jgi:GT2 family glycosyltransferase
MKTTDLTIIIVNWNTRKLLEECLSSIFRSPTKVCYEVWVVDNASSDGSVSMVRNQFPEVRLIENHENMGFARANNIVIQKNESKFVLLLNSDAYLKPGAMDEMVEFMYKNSQVGAAGSRLLNPDGSLQYSVHPMPTLFREFWRMFHLDALFPVSSYPLDRWDLKTPRIVDVVQGACLILRKEAIEEVGLLDESFFFYSEEVDYCYRLKEKGYKIYWLPKAEAVHYGGQSSKQMPDQMFLELYRGKILFFRKHKGRPGVIIYKAILMFATLNRLLLSPFAWLQKRPDRIRALNLINKYSHLLIELPRL